MDTMDKLEFIYQRHSVRKFKTDAVPDADIRELVRAAIHAPSGKNMQNWQFVVIKDARKIADIAALVEKKNAQLAGYLTDAAQIKAFTGTVAYHTVFKNAPALILVYAGPYETVADMLLEAGVMPAEEAAKYGTAVPGIQNAAAAMENLLLAAANMGYGTCWMTGPTYAAEEIADYIGRNTIKPGYHLVCMTPLGVPESDTWSYPPRKPVDEVLTIIG